MEEKEMEGKGGEYKITRNRNKKSNLEFKKIIPTKTCLKAVFFPIRLFPCSSSCLLPTLQCQVIGGGILSSSSVTTCVLMPSWIAYLESAFYHAQEKREIFFGKICLTAAKF